MKNSDWLTIRDVAAIYKLHPRTIQKYVRDGRIKAKRIGGRVRIPRSELAVFERDYIATEDGHG